MKQSQSISFKIAFLLFCLMVLVNSFESLINWFKAGVYRAYLTHPNEAILAILGYISLVGIAYLAFEFLISFRLNTLPDMSFEAFKDEPQFNLRDFSDENKADLAKIEDLKTALGLNKKSISLEEIVAEANESNNVFQINQANKRRKTTD